MEDVFVTVLVDKKVFNSVKGGLGPGSSIKLKKEPTNRYDKKAIAVKLATREIGYIANTENSTVLEGTLSATEIYDKFQNKTNFMFATITEFKKEGFMNLYYKAKLTLPKKEKEKKDSNNQESNKIINFKLTGGISTYPGKQELIRDIDGTLRLVKLVLENNRVLGKYKDKFAGVVRDGEEEFEIIEKYIKKNTANKKETTARAISVNRGIIECELEIVSDVEIKKTKETIEKLIDEIVLNKINTKTEVDEKINYMKECEVPKAAILSLLESYVEYPEEVKKRIPKKPKVVYIDTTGIVKDSICYININSNLLFEGEKGVGKNVLAETLAWLYNRPLYEFSSNSQHSNVSLLGSQTFEDAEKDDEKEKKNTVKSFLTLIKIVKNIFSKDTTSVNKTDLKGVQKFIYKLFGESGKDLVFEKSSILEAFEKGGIIVLDEFNTSLAHVIPIFNALLDERRRMEVTGLGQVKGHPNFTAIATQNKDYEGTFEGNEATMDRFEPILFPPSNSIVEILKERVPNISSDIIIKVNDLYSTMQSSVRSGELDNQSLSIRGFISACEVLKQGKTLKDALITSVANRIRDDEYRKAVINMIDLKFVDFED